MSLMSWTSWKRLKLKRCPEWFFYVKKSLCTEACPADVSCGYRFRDPPYRQIRRVFPFWKNFGKGLTFQEKVCKINLEKNIYSIFRCNLNFVCKNDAIGTAETV